MRFPPSYPVNDFLWPLLVADTDAARTLPVGVALVALRRWLQTNLVVAGSLLVMVPLVGYILSSSRPSSKASS